MVIILLKKFISAIYKTVHPRAIQHKIGRKNADGSVFSSVMAVVYAI